MDYAVFQIGDLFGAQSHPGAVKILNERFFPSLGEKCFIDFHS